MNKQDNKEDVREIKILDEQVSNEVVFCDFILEHRVGDTYYITGTQLVPSEKLKAVNNNQDEINALKKVTLVMGKETFSNFLNSHQNFIEELKTQGVIKDENK